MPEVYYRGRLDFPFYKMKAGERFILTGAHFYHLQVTIRKIVKTYYFDIKISTKRIEQDSNSIIVTRTK